VLPRLSAASRGGAGWQLELVVLGDDAAVAELDGAFGSCGVASVVEGEYVTRARVTSGQPTPMVEALTATNELAELLDRHRLEVVDATTLLQRIMDEVDVAFVGFDEEGRVQLCNRVANTLLSIPDAVGRTAQALGIGAWLQGPSPRVVEPPGVSGRRWQLRRARLRQGGRPFQLVILSDLGKLLDEEARRSAFKVVRVLSHEVNNSLAPIGSVAEALASRIPAEADEEQQRIKRNLAMIAERTESLGRFLAKFSELAKLPPPVPCDVRVRDWIHRVVALEAQPRIDVVDGPDVTVRADPSQLDRALVLPRYQSAGSESDAGEHLHPVRGPR
jgi:nitrogen fixation/metabolism regulation signal transduction histidine kinase